MYDELVKRLRIVAQWADNGLIITPSVCLEAADAIEELQKQIAKSEADNINLTGWLAEEHANKCPHYIHNVHDRGDDSMCKKWLCEINDIQRFPRWIPVTDKEHIPNTDHGVVGYFGGGAFNQLRWYDFITTLSDGTIVCESTERDVISEHCIAVYKLPEPPKEEA